MKAKQVLEVEFREDGQFELNRRMGDYIETYRTMEKDEALVAIMAILGGYEPPRTYRPLDQLPKQVQKE